MRLLFQAIFLLIVATSALSAQSGTRNVTFAADSVVLVRTSCLGTCPAYRLSVRNDGFVWFLSRNRGEEGRVESHTRGPDIMRRIERELERSRFASLPTIPMGQAPYCRVVATDAPTITVNEFRSHAIRSVSYYTGCLGETPQDTLAQAFIRRLRVLADSIDSIAAGKGWIRPAKCCDI